MLSPFDDLIDYETGKVNPNWRSNASVQAYLKRRGDERGGPRLYYEARAQWVPVVLRVRLVQAGHDDLVDVLAVIQNREGYEFGKQVRVARRAGRSGVPPGVSTVYLEGEGSRWSLFGGGAEDGASHHSAE